jgi:hypothetical protein
MGAAGCDAREAFSVSKGKGETMSIHKPSKKSEIASDQKLIAGIEKHLEGISVMILGTTYTGSQLVQEVRARLDAVEANLVARARWQTAVQAEQRQLANSQSTMNLLRRALHTMFKAADDLADFGLTPHRRATLTPAERVAAVAKAKATRAARHTMRKRQRQAIHGVLMSPAGDPPMPSEDAALLPRERHAEERMTPLEREEHPIHEPVDIRDELGVAIDPDLVHAEIGLSRDAAGPKYDARRSVRRHLRAGIVNGSDVAQHLHRWHQARILPFHGGDEARVSFGIGTQDLQVTAGEANCLPTS